MSLNSIVKILKQGQINWAGLSFDERKQVIHRYKDLVAEHKDTLAKLIHSEMGKVPWEAAQEVNAVMGKIDISISSFLDRCPDREKELPAGISVIRHRPHGVVLVLGPFNFPAHLPNGHIIPALLAGNSVIFKPSDKTPKTGEKLVELMHMAGIPETVVRCVQGSVEDADFLVKHPDIHAIFFTGSSTVGRSIQKTALQFPRKLVALEMGGNNALVISSYKDLDAAALSVVQSAFATSGQRCTCARRLVVVDTPENRTLIERVIDIASKLKVGTDNNAYMGPLVSDTSAKKMCDVFTKTVEAGAKSLLELTSLGGAAVSPGILDVTGLDMPDEEYFGPLTFLTWVPNLSEAIRVANTTEYGLAAGLLSASESEYIEFRQSVHAGIVNWNVQTTGASSGAPFGGVGLSGNFRPSAYYAADYCAYPVASIEASNMSLPETLPPGVTL